MIGDRDWVSVCLYIICILYIYCTLRWLIYLYIFLHLLQLYSMILEDPPTIKLVISSNRTCEGLSEIMANDVHTVSEGLRHFHDGSVALLLTKDWPHPFSSSDVWRKKRSALKDDLYRFVSL